jgi:DNA-binding transcriptional ArsR family regulator
MFLPIVSGVPRATTSDDLVYRALASATRRGILDLLADGPRPVNDLAGHFDMSRPSVSEHLKVLRQAGLVTETKHGRERLYRLEPAPLAEVHDWLHPYERFWRGRLRDLQQVLDQTFPPDPEETP